LRTCGVHKILLSALAGFIVAVLSATAVVGIQKPHYNAGYQAGYHAAHRYVPTRQIMVLTQAAQLPTQGAVVLLGDSITDGMLPPANSGNLLNAGVSSAKVADIPPLAKEIFAQVKPSVVLVTVGVNDAQKNGHFCLENLQKEFRKICTISPRYPTTHDVDDASRDVRLILSTVLPIARNMPLGDAYFDVEKIQQINAVIRTVADEENVELLDAFTHFADSDGFLPREFTTDGVHLNAAGYEKWKELIMPLL